jgi:hypothetical protein
MKAERTYVLAPMGRVGVGGGEGKEDVRASGALMIWPPPFRHCDTLTTHYLTL